MAQKKNAAAEGEATETTEATVVKIQQNGVTRPREGSTTGRVWAIADEISADQKAPATRKQVIDRVVAENINASTGATQYGKWRKFHGLEGERAPGRQPKPEGAPPVPPAPSVETDTE